MPREKVYSIQAVTLVRQKTSPPTLRIEVRAIARSTGWTSAALEPRFSSPPPSDGIYEFDLTAERPTGITHPTLTPIQASHLITDPPEAMRGVRVHSETDHKEAAL